MSGFAFGQSDKESGLLDLASPAPIKDALGWGDQPE